MSGGSFFNLLAILILIRQTTFPFLWVASPDPIAGVLPQGCHPIPFLTFIPLSRPAAPSPPSFLRFLSVFFFPHPLWSNLSCLIRFFGFLWNDVTMSAPLVFAVPISFSYCPLHQSLSERDTVCHERSFFRTPDCSCFPPRNHPWRNHEICFLTSLDKLSPGGAPPGTTGPVPLLFAVHFRILCLRRGARFMVYLPCFVNPHVSNRFFLIAQPFAVLSVCHSTSVVIPWISLVLLPKKLLEN